MFNLHNRSKSTKVQSSKKIPQYMLKSSSCLHSSNLGTFWHKIKQLWLFEEIYIFSNGGHLGWRAWVSDITFKGNPLTADMG
jgi:hypothetical protein